VVVFPDSKNKSNEINGMYFSKKMNFFSNSLVFEQF